MKTWLAVSWLVVTLVSLAALEANAQCCDPACVDADGDGAEDDSVRCGPLVAGAPFVSGCADAPPAGCAGGATRSPAGDPVRLPAVGCICIGSTCGADDPESGEIVVPATAEQCARGAAFFCNEAGNVAEVTLDDPTCD